MKSAAVFVGLLAAGVVAQPHGHKHRRAQHNHGLEKRDMVVVVETEIEQVTVTEYIDQTTTTWITPAAKATVTTSLAKAVPTKDVPGQFFEGSSSTTSKESPVAPTPPTTAPVVVPTTPAYVPPPPPAPTTPATHPAPAVPSVAAPAPVPSVAAPAPVPSVAAPAPVPSVAAPAPVQAEPAAAPQQGSDSSNKSGGETHTGDLTFYAPGLGACGVVSAPTDHIVAISHILMGTVSNGNPMCGKTITITKGGKSTTATVVDKCMGCAADNIDVSEPVFLEIAASLDVGREAGVSWYFN